MRLPQTVLFLLTLFTTIHAFALPSLYDFTSSSQDLFKRKGGGGGGGRGGGGSSSSGSSSSGSSSSGSSSSGGSRGGSTGSTGSTGSSGGSTGGSSSSGSRGGNSATGFSGTSGARAPSFGSGGQYYGGGARSPYGAGRAGPSGLVPGLLIGGAAASLLVLPGIWAYSFYNYPYSRPWNYYNTTASQNETHPVQCLCEQYSDCGCDEGNRDQDYINSVANNNTIAQLANVNGTQTLVINGTIPNATEDASDSTSNSGSGTTSLPPSAGVSLAIGGGAGGWAVIAGSIAVAVWAL